MNFSAKEATFFFDETINDRGTDAQDVTNMFLVSPSDGTPRVGYHRSRIDVRPRHGFRPNTAYTITLLPGLTDLRNNRMKTGATIVFSTGPTIPTLRITGVAFDWGQEQPLPQTDGKARMQKQLIRDHAADALVAVLRIEHERPVGVLPEQHRSGLQMAAGVVALHGEKAVAGRRRFEAIQRKTLEVLRPGWSRRKRQYRK